MKIPAIQWIGWMGAVVVSAVMGSAYVFMVFETKADSQSKRAALEKTMDDRASATERRFDSVDRKLDLLLERAK